MWRQLASSDAGYRYWPQMNHKCNVHTVWGFMEYTAYNHCSPTHKGHNGLKRCCFDDCFEGCSSCVTFSRSPLNFLDANLWCNTYAHLVLKQIKSTWSDDERVPMFPHKKRKTWRFWVGPILRRRHERGGFHGSVEEVKLRISSIFQGQLSSCWQSWDYMWVAVRLR